MLYTILESVFNEVNTGRHRFWVPASSVDLPINIIFA
jgi:hypothetical protein